MYSIEEVLTLEPTIIGEKEENAIDARKIYIYLELKEDFSDWVKRTIDKYGFKEGEEYIRFVSTSLGNKEVKVGLSLQGKKTDYIVTMDMAKELCMVSNTEKGKETRKYFIQVEKGATKTLSKLDTLKLAIESEEKYQAQLGVNKLLVNKIDTISEKAKALTDEISNLDEARTHYAGEDQSILIGEFAKSIFDFKALRIGPNNIFKVLNDMGYLFKRNSKWLPHQRFQDQDLFVVRPVTYDHPHTGKPQVTTQTEITTKGIETLPAKIIAFVKEERKRIYG